MFGKDKKTRLLLTTGMNHLIEEEFKKSKKFIFIVSPYLQLNEKIEEILQNKITKGIQVTIMCRVGDLKTKINLVCPIIDNPRIHAKCYITENMAILGSLNLYEFSQRKNDEMGIITYKKINNRLYKDILKENKLLIESNQKVYPLINNKKLYSLRQSEKYDLEHLEKLFNFDYKDNAGIKISKNHPAIVLFSNTKYAKKSKNGLILYQGHNTGGKQQELILRNKELYDTYGNNTKAILFFEDYCYKGLVKIAKKPHRDKKGVWIFPLQAI